MYNAFPTHHRTERMKCSDGCLHSGLGLNLYDGCLWPRCAIHVHSYPRQRVSWARRACRAELVWRWSASYCMARDELLMPVHTARLGHLRPCWHSRETEGDWICENAHECWLPATHLFPSRFALKGQISQKQEHHFCDQVKRNLCFYMDIFTAW